jgi:two-component system NarL family response regulator
MKILIVDDHILFREGLVSLLKKQPDFQVIGEAGTVDEAIQLAIARSPDVILMDFSLPDGTGLDATQAILAHLPKTKIVFLTVHETDDRLFSAVRSGAKGYLLKNIPVTTLLASLRALDAGEMAISPSMSTRIIEEYAQNPSYPSHNGPPVNTSLTTREIEILSLISKGSTNREIAQKLVISENTVKNHIHNILEKLGLKNRREALQYARRFRLIE